MYGERTEFYLNKDFLKNNSHVMLLIWSWILCYKIVNYDSLV